MTRTASANELRRKILEEAIGIVYSEGTEKITMRALGDKLGYSPATIYLYFRNKDELLQEIARYGFERMAERSLPALEHEDPVEGLRAAGRAYVDFALQNPALFQLMFRMLPPPRQDPERHRMAHAMFRARCDLIRRGIEQGVLLGEDAEILGSLHTAALHGFAELALTGRMPLPESSRTLSGFRYEFVDRLVDALRARP